jgi:hypothetical protein
VALTGRVAVRGASSISDSSPSEDLYVLRKPVKVLRQALEMFGKVRRQFAVLFRASPPVRSAACESAGDERRGLGRSHVDLAGLPVRAWIRDALVLNGFRT